MSRVCFLFDYKLVFITADNKIPNMVGDVVFYVKCVEFKACLKFIRNGNTCKFEY